MGIDRRAARELALACLHQWDQRGPDDGRELAEVHIRESAPEPRVAAYARQLLESYWAEPAAIDERIEVVAEHWRLERMAVIDRNVLRLAVTEMYHVDAVPPRVTIDEAIELAKMYSTERSGAFVNGILDRILADWEREHGAR
ncbi:MAG: transcription antitermination factor NusB [Planctomycetota bacterium]